MNRKLPIVLTLLVTLHYIFVAAVKLSGYMSIVLVIVTLTLSLLTILLITDEDENPFS